MRGVETEGRFQPPAGGATGSRQYVQFKMANFLWPRCHDVKRPFCAPGHDEGVQRISSGYAKLSPTTRIFSESVGGATESL